MSMGEKYTSSFIPKYLLGSYYVRHYARGWQSRVNKTKFLPTWNLYSND